ncbi:MAG: hypothetical protein GC181_16165 [Bacteroidetes bacterium]|nr:hypothetical protein [Bacteroidota bacterium]
MFRLLRGYLAFFLAISLLTGAFPSVSNLTFLGLALIVFLLSVKYGNPVITKFHQFQVSRFSNHTIILAGLILRIIYALICGFENWQNDYLYYENSALYIAGGGDWIDPFKQSGPSLLMGALYYLFGTHRWLVLLFNGFFYLAGCVLILAIARSQKLSKHREILLLILYCLLPESIWFFNLINSDVPFSVFTLAILFLVLNKKNPYLMGAAIGLSVWFRPLGIVFLVATILYFYLSDKSQFAKKSVRVTTSYLILLIPFFISNYQKFGITSFKPVHMDGWTLLLSSQTENKGMFDGELLDKYLTRYPEENSRIATYKKRLIMNREMKEDAIQAIRKSPFKWFRSFYTVKSGQLIGKSAVSYYPQIEGLRTATFLRAADSISYYLVVLSVILVLLQFNTININPFIILLLFIGTHIFLFTEINSRYHLFLTPVFLFIMIRNAIFPKIIHP